MERSLATVVEDVFDRPLAIYTAQLFDLGAHPYILLSPVLVVIETYPDEVVARLPFSDLYAAGKTDSQALMRLKDEIVDTYERLEEIGPDQLGPLPREWLRTFRVLVSRSNG